MVLPALNTAKTDTSTSANIASSYPVSWSCQPEDPEIRNFERILAHFHSGGDRFFGHDSVENPMSDTEKKARMCVVSRLSENSLPDFYSLASRYTAGMIRVATSCWPDVVPFAEEQCMSTQRDIYVVPYMIVSDTSDTQNPGSIKLDLCVTTHYADGVPGPDESIVVKGPVVLASVHCDKEETDPYVLVPRSVTRAIAGLEDDGERDEEFTKLLLGQ